MELQRHVLRCINTGRQMKLMVQRLSKEQVPASTKPHSGGSEIHKCQSETLKNDEILQQHANLPLNPMPGEFKCGFDQCNLSFSSSADLNEHKRVHIIQALKLVCNECGKFFHRKRLLMLHMQRHTHLRPHACDVLGCSYKAKVHEDLKAHKKKVHPSILYTCLLCGKSLKSHVHYKRHIAKHNKGGDLLKCFFKRCNQKFLNANDLQNHVKEHHSYVKLFHCNECSKCFAYKGMLEKHIVIHLDWRPFKCDIPGCSYSAKRSHELIKHKNRLHTLERLTCNLCGESFKNGYYFMQHYEKHKTRTPGAVKCHITGCQETFSVPADLKTHTMKQHYLNSCDIPGCLFTSELKRDLCVHRRKVHSIWPHNCQLCGKGFDNNKSLTQHLKSHKTGEPGVIKCAKNNCKQTFTSNAELKNHLDNHKYFYHRDNEFECHLCGKIIKGSRSQFQVHILRHETGTPGVMKCIFKGCYKTFVSAADLKQHTFKHLDVSLRPFACDFPQCNYACKTNQTLLSHKCKVHSSNLYTCDLCGKQFKHLSYVAQHFKRQHKNPQSEDDSQSNVHKPKTAEEYQELVCKDEIEEVVFD
jgi:KRAB domain-containing zinc finger protein